MASNENPSQILKYFTIAIISVLLGAVITLFTLQYSGPNKGENTIEEISMPLESRVLTIGEAAEYLRMTEEEVKRIIITEESYLKKQNSFIGRMLPYFIVNGKYYVDKEQLNQWIYDVSMNRRVYDTDIYTMKR